MWVENNEERVYQVQWHSYLLLAEQTGERNSLLGYRASVGCGLCAFWVRREGVISGYLALWHDSVASCSVFHRTLPALTPLREMGEHVQRKSVEGERN